MFRSDTNEKTQNVFLVLLYSKIKIQFFELAFKIWLLQWFKNTIFVSITIITITAILIFPHRQQLTSHV